MLLGRKATDSSSEDRRDGDVGAANEGSVVDESKQPCEELAIHSVGHASMSRDAVTKVLDAKRSLESRGKESSEGSHEGSENREDNRVELEGSPRNRGNGAAGLSSGDEWRKEGKRGTRRREMSQL